MIAQITKWPILYRIVAIPRDCHENNNKFVRGKKRVCEDIERYLRHHYGAIQGRDGDYHLKISYRTDEELDNTVQDLLQHITLEADLRNCFSESDATMEGSDHRNW